MPAAAPARPGPRTGAPGRDRSGGPGTSRGRGGHRRLRVLPEEPLAHGPPMGEGDRRVASRPSPGPRRTASRSVGASRPARAGRSSSRRRGLERVAPRRSLSGGRGDAPSRTSRPDDDQDERPELAPADRRQVEPERALGEEPQPEATRTSPTKIRPLRRAIVARLRRRPGRMSARAAAASLGGPAGGGVRAVASCDDGTWSRAVRRACRRAVRARPWRGLAMAALVGRSTPS